MQAFGSLGANDEGTRKRIIERDHFMDRLVGGLDDGNESIVIGAVHCLHSLSRSVHLLRTTFKVSIINNESVGVGRSRE